MKVWIVWHGDGYGHDSVVAIYQTERAAKALETALNKGRRRGYWMDDYEAEEWPNQCAACGDEDSYHKIGECTYCGNCEGFKPIER